jgi:hypothetical protein
MGGFIVERYWPGVTQDDVRAASAALHSATAALAPADQATSLGPADPAVNTEPLRYLGGILLAGDEVVLFGFEASDVALVEAAGAAAGVRCDRVVPATFLD